ncbi:MAG: outer membrane beta-barrel protein [Thermodesulfobacteriota bacterium]|nr:outer membrane beta-barrel protein [Thermodesulfobacteriota bacterium]
MLNPARIQSEDSQCQKTTKGSWKRLFSTIPFLLLLMCPVAFAAVESDIVFSLDTEEQYSDDFYRRGKKEIEVHTTLIKPRIAAKAWTGRSSFFFSYAPTFNYYHDDSSRVDASDDDFVGHELDLAAETTFFERLGFTLTERFQRTREPGAYDVLQQSEASREKYKVNQISPFLTYDFAEKFTAIVGYRNESYDYDDSDDSREHRGYFTLRYNLDDRNSVEVEEQYWTRQYDDNPDYDSSQIKLIFRRELSDFLKCEIGAGYHDREFESGSANVEDFSSFIYRLAVTGESDVSRIFVSFLRNLNDVSLGTSYFDAHRLTLGLEHTFVDRIRGSVGGYFQDNDYDTWAGVTSDGTLDLREDEIWSGHLGVRYWLADWVSAGVHYEYTDRDSNIEGESYSENRIFGNVRIEYSTALRR